MLIMRNKYTFEHLIEIAHQHGLKTKNETDREPFELIRDSLSLAEIIEIILDNNHIELIIAFWNSLNLGIPSKKKRYFHYKHNNHAYPYDFGGTPVFLTVENGFSSDAKRLIIPTRVRWPHDDGK